MQLGLTLSRQVIRHTLREADTVVDVASEVQSADRENLNETSSGVVSHQGHQAEYPVDCYPCAPAENQLKL